MSKFDPIFEVMLKRMLDKTEVPVAIAILKKKKTDREISEETGIELEKVKVILKKLVEMEFATCFIKRTSRGDVRRWKINYETLDRIHDERLKNMGKEAKKRVKEIDELFEEATSELIETEMYPIIELLFKEQLTDEEISEKLMIKLNLVRRVLYILEENDLAEYDKEVDAKGWYFYRWRLRREMAKQYLTEKRKELLDKLLERYAYETSEMLFSCYSGICPVYNFKDALEHNFICPMCGERLEQYDNEERLKELKGRIERLKEQI